MLEWHNKTQDDSEQYEGRQRSSSHTSGGSPSSMGSLPRSNSAPTNSGFDSPDLEQMEQECPPGDLLNRVRQTLGESTSAGVIFSGTRAAPFVSKHTCTFVLKRNQQ